MQQHALRPFSTDAELDRMLVCIFLSCQRIPTPAGTLRCTFVTQAGDHAGAYMNVPQGALQEGTHAHMATDACTCESRAAEQQTLAKVRAHTQTALAQAVLGALPQLLSPS